MPTIVELLIAERDRLTQAIELLQGGASTGGKTAKTKTTRKPWSEERRKEASARQKATWAKRKKGKS